MRKPSRGDIQSERGTVKALVDQSLQATSSVAREDRDGCSRYRASKMSPDRGIIRVVPRYLRPYRKIGVFLIS